MKLLWITKDSSSEQLSHSSRAEEAKIRHHVQRKHTETTARDHRTKAGQVRAALTASTIILSPGEKRSLNYFIHCTGPEWSGWEDSEFWNGLALQACQQDQAIAHGLIALAAWHKCSSSPPNSPLAYQYRQLAVSQHSRASTLVWTSNELTHSASLISCVILASLQSYDRSFEEHGLLRSGAAILLEKQKVEVLSEPYHGTSPSTISRQVGALISRMQARPCMILDQQAALACSIEHRESQEQARHDIPVIPSSFGTLRKARDCLESILDWAHDHVLQARSEPDAWNFFRFLFGERVRQWEGALKSTPLLGESHHRGLYLLQIAALNGMILILTYAAQEETAFDCYTHLFHRIIQLVEQIPFPKVHGGRVSFGIDSGLIDIVAFVGARCREPRIRRAALDWLQDIPRLEGERLSSVTGPIVQAWINLEEQGQSNAITIPESSRRRLVAGERYHERGLIKLIFASSPYVAAAGAHPDVVWLRTATSAGSEELLSTKPDVVFSPGHAAFLDYEKGVYHHLHSTTFHFPIPRA